MKPLITLSYTKLRTVQVYSRYILHTPNKTIALNLFCNNGYETTGQNVNLPNINNVVTGVKDILCKDSIINLVKSGDCYNDYDKIIKPYIKIKMI